MSRPTLDHAYEGARVLFTLARPWSAGELRSVLDTTLGCYGLSCSPSQ